MTDGSAQEPQTPQGSGTRESAAGVSVLSATAACSALLFSMGIVMLSNGLQGTLLGLRATFEGFATETTGMVMSGYFVGFAAGSLLAPKLVQRVGHVRVFAALASLASVIPLLHAMVVDPYFWFVGRVFTGFAFAGIYVVAESWLNDRATNATRGKLLSVYMIVNVGAMGGGPLLLNLSTPLAVDLFVLASVLVSLALIPILLAASPTPNIEETEKMGIVALYRLSPLGVIGMIATGMSNGALVSMGAVYADALSFSVAEVSIFISLIFLGSVVLQFPIGMLSDRFDRRMVLLVVTVLAALVPFIILTANVSSVIPMMIIFSIFGGLTFPMYSLCISHANDRLSSKQMLTASSTLVLACGIGAVAGPPGASYAMAMIGTDGFLWYFVAVHAGIGLFVLYRMSRRAATPMEDQENIAFTPHPAAMSPAFASETIIEMTEGAVEADGDTQESGAPPT